MSNNLYIPGPLMIDSGRFWRCKHGFTRFKSCWRCGLFRPWEWLHHVFDEIRGG